VILTVFQDMRGPKGDNAQILNFYCLSNTFDLMLMIS
jgi:hypothetical protein